MMFDMHDGWGGWMILGWIWMIVLWGLIVWAVYTVISRLGGSNDHRSQGSDAQAILEERFARGEITREEFADMRRTLADKNQPSSPTQVPR
jgi:putative membrane protein